MSAKLDLTSSNPDLAGFDLDNMVALGAYSDGSGGGIRELAWQLQKLRECQERINLLNAFIRKHQMLLARLSWGVEITSLPPVKREDILFVPEIQLFGWTFDKQKATPQSIAAQWPEAQWSRSLPSYSGEAERVRDYTAEIDGVTVRIKNAERLPEPVKVDRFKACGPLRKSEVQS